MIEIENPSSRTAQECVVRHCRELATRLAVTLSVTPELDTVIGQSSSYFLLNTVR